MNNSHSYSTSLGLLWNPNQYCYLFGMWQFDPIFIPECGNRSHDYARTWKFYPSYLCLTVAIWSISYAKTWQPIPIRHHNHNNQYIIKIIQLCHEFMVMIIHLTHLQLSWSILQHSYIYEYHNEVRTNIYHTNIESKPSPTNYSTIPITYIIMNHTQPQFIIMISY